jgi:hypothetical protein
MPERKPKTFRPTPEALAILARLKRKLGLTQTAIIELALRRLDEEEAARRPKKSD